MRPVHGPGPCQPTTVTPDLDPILRCKTRALRFLSRLWDLGLRETTSSKQGTVNLSFVFLKIYEQDWGRKLVWDLLKVNLYPFRPPRIRLGRPWCLAELGLS